MPSISSSGSKSLRPVTVLTELQHQCLSPWGACAAAERKGGRGLQGLARPERQEGATAHHAVEKNDRAHALGGRGHHCSPESERGTQRWLWGCKGGRFQSTLKISALRPR
eukprot:949696-Rhodomonas_salina.1